MKRRLALAWHLAWTALPMLMLLYSAFFADEVAWTIFWAVLVLSSTIDDARDLIVAELQMAQRQYRLTRVERRVTR